MYFSFLHLYYQYLILEEEILNWWIIEDLQLYFIKHVFFNYHLMTKSALSNSMHQGVNVKTVLSASLFNNTYNYFAFNP